MSAVQAFLQHLQVERRMSAHTLDAYRRDLDALAVWAQPRGVAVEALDADALRQFVADEHRRGLSARACNAACRPAAASMPGCSSTGASRSVRQRR